MSQKLGHPYKGRWSDAKQRCKQCWIVLVAGKPPSPCFRGGCRFQTEVPSFESVSPIASTLAGGDFSDAGQ